jgi:hypothetical protein
LAVTCLASGALFAIQHRVMKPQWDILWRVHLLALPVPLIVAYLPRLGGRYGLLLLVFYLAVPTTLAPLLLGERFRPAAPGSRVSA